MPLFSVIIPTKNRASLLKEAIDSVLQQSHEDFELIVIDDHSHDKTKNVIDSFNDKRIIYALNKSEERSAARNTGIDLANGEYICFLDDDDYYAENYLNDFYLYLSEHHFPKDVILRTGFIKVFEDGKQKKSAMYDKKKHKNAVRFAAYNMCGVWTLCIPKILLKENKYDERFSSYEDTHLLLRLFKEYNLHQLHGFNYRYRIYPSMGSIIVHNKNVIEKCENNLKGIRNIFDEHLKGNEFLNDKDKKYIISEKYIQYALRCRNPKDKKLLITRSINHGVYFRLWKYYIRFLYG